MGVLLTGAPGGCPSGLHRVAAQGLYCPQRPFSGCPMMALSGTILVADDEALARHSVVEVLQDEGYRVYEAADGTAALKLLDEVEVDLLLSDLKMPGVDGLAVLKKVREVSPQTMVML